MLIRFLVFLFGILTTSIGLMYFLIYVSLFGSGTSFLSYLMYFLTRVEIYLLPLGLIITLISICFDYYWHKFIKLRKEKLTEAKKHYKELIKSKALTIKEKAQKMENRLKLYRGSIEDLGFKRVKKKVK